MSKVIYIATSDPQSCVNRQRTATLGAVESDEPSLAAGIAISQIDISLEYNMKSCIVFNFSKLAILKTQHYILLATTATQNTVKDDSRYYSNPNVCSVAIFLYSHLYNAKSDAYFYFGTHITAQKNVT